jgi:hypothetical protein
MESPKLKIPKSFFENFDIVVKYQNVQLILAICEFKGWDKSRVDEITNSFFNGETPRNKVKPSRIVSESNTIEISKSTPILNIDTAKPKHKKLVRRKKSVDKNIDHNIINERIVYIQRPIEIDGNKYLLEDPTNNMYEIKTGKFVGIYYLEKGGIAKINTRSQEN